VVTIPVSLWAMSNPRLGVQEYPELKALIQGADALELGYGDPVVTRARLAAYLDERVLSGDKRVLLDAYQGAAIAVQTRHSDRLIMSFDRRFGAALADPARNRIDYVLLPDPAFWPQDAVNRLRPRLWEGKEPGFRLVRTFEAGPAFALPESWRLYAVRDGVRVLSRPNGGGG
jgi:hypothetical protein